MRKAELQTLPVREAVGSVLCHDITQIIPGKSKGPLFRKGHVITAEDVEALLNLGKENIYVFTETPGFVHENEAAARIVAKIMGPNLVQTSPKEGRIDFKAACTGLLKVDVASLMDINSLGEITVATLHSLQYVQEGQSVAGTRVVPLFIAEEKLKALEELVKEPVIQVLPCKKLTVGIVTTGSEVYSGRIQDAFGPVLRKKFAALGCTVQDQIFCSDDQKMIAKAIQDFLEQNVGLIVVTGGMSVDPDDRTPSAIREAGCEIISYGAPVYPGAMFLLAWAKDGQVPVLGLPGCVMYVQASIFDLLVPRLLAGLDVTARDIAALGHGGFCSQCPSCHYPICPFGKY